MRKEIPEFTCIPKGYGLAYRCMDRLVLICYPIPFNLIVRKWHDFYWRIMSGWFPVKHEKKMLKISKEIRQKEKNKLKQYINDIQGRFYRKGYNEGIQKGYTEGYEARRAENIDTLKAIRKKCSFWKKERS